MNSKDPSYCFFFFFTSFLGQLLGISELFDSRKYYSVFFFPPWIPQAKAWFSQSLWKFMSGLLRHLPSTVLVGAGVQSLLWDRSLCTSLILLLELWFVPVDAVSRSHIVKQWSQNWKKDWCGFSPPILHSAVISPDFLASVACLVSSCATSALDFCFVWSSEELERSVCSCIAVRIFQSIFT